MNATGVQQALTGMALFDMYVNAVRKARHQHKPEGSPLVAAACKAFEAYLHIQEVGHSAQIAGVAAYVLNPSGTSASPVSSQQMAPFLALNVMA